MVLFAKSKRKKQVTHSDNDDDDYVPDYTQATDIYTSNRHLPQSLPGTAYRPWTTSIGRPYTEAVAH